MSAEASQSSAPKESEEPDATGNGEDGPKIEGEAKFAAIDVSTGEENEEALWKKCAAHPSAVWMFGCLPDCLPVCLFSFEF